MVAERATEGLAKARESLGELDQARRGYETVANEYPSSPMANLATEHAEDLAQEKTKEFYNWFAEQRLTNAAPEETSSSKQDTSSKAEQPKVETKKEKKAQEKEADSSPASESTSPAPESAPAAPESTAEE